MYLEKINGPSDVKLLSEDELPVLASEVRELLIDKLSKTGGHVGSNLGVVELSVALHYVFDSPKDKIIWDVSHQSYAHKILTGRREAYSDPLHYRDVTGFTDPKESEHDLFRVGHTATSVSLALGMAKARDAAHSDDNVIAVIGDGALSGGESYEALNYAGEYEGNLIIIINDNDQSVAENHGGLYKTLKRLRESGGRGEDNYFRSLNLDYMYLEEGNDAVKIADALKKLKGTKKPVVLHLHTIKGKGLPYAEQDRENWHSGAPFEIETGYPKNGYPKYDTTVYDSLINLLETDEKSQVLTAGTPRALGFVGEVRDYWEAKGRFTDVGIAEESAVAMSSGMAKYGSSAVFGVYAPFIQRAYDQISHDLCLNNNPATILVLLPGAYGMKSNTHLGLCDIQMLCHIPNLIYMTPAYREEYLKMFRYAVSQREHPVAIRVPVRFVSCGYEDETDYSLTDKAKVMRKGSGSAIIATGSLIPKALTIADRYKEETGRDITVINPVFLTGTDDELLGNLEENHSLVITIEDGEKDSGYGARIASFYGLSKMKVINLGISKKFHSDFDAEALLSENGISEENILNLIKNNQEK